MIDFNSDIEAAKKGRQIWLQIKEKYQFIPQSSCLVIMPTDEDDMNKIALNMLPDYMKKKYIDLSVVVTSKDYAKINNTPCIKYENMPLGKIDLLIKYYRLQQFTKNIVVISLDEPFGNSDFIGKENITLENYIADALYI